MLCPYTDKDVVFSQAAPLVSGEVSWNGEINEIRHKARSVAWSRRQDNGDVGEAVPVSCPCLRAQLTSQLYCFTLQLLHAA